MSSPSKLMNTMEHETSEEVELSSSEPDSTMEHVTSKKVEPSSSEILGPTIVDDGMNDEIRKMLMEIPGPSLVDTEIDPKVRKAGIDKTKHLLQPFVSGEPYFTKAMLEELEIKLAEKKNHVKGTPFEDPSGLFDGAEELPDDSWFYFTLYNDVPAVVQHNIRGISDDLRPIFVFGTEVQDYQRDALERNTTEVKAIYQSCRKAWLDSQAFASLKDQLDASPVLINKIVCFGLGTLTHPYESENPASNTQHAVVESLIEYLKERTSGDIPCYAQDPGYLNSDKELLKTLGIDTIENPKGFLKIDEETLVVSIHPDVCVRQIVSDLQWRPAAMIWDTVKSLETDKAWWDGYVNEARWELNGRPVCSTDPTSPRLRMMVENYVQHQISYPTEFENVTLYIRKSESDSTASST